MNALLYLEVQWLRTSSIFYNGCTCCIMTNMAIKEQLETENLLREIERIRMAAQQENQRTREDAEAFR